MKKKYGVLIIALAIYVIMINNQLYAHLKTSLIIPCTYKHAHYLPNLIEFYELQTVLPDEIIISLSESDHVLPKIINILENTTWKIPVTLLSTPEKLYAGINRNRASEVATGNILIYQDADDLPHPQRIEIIRDLFEKHKIDHLIHTYYFKKDITHFPIHTNHKQYLHKSKNYSKIWTQYKQVMFGVPAISKELFNRIKWPHDKKGQDIKYTQNIYKISQNCFILNMPLYIYRIEFSSWNDKDFLNDDLHWQNLYTIFHETY